MTSKDLKMEDNLKFFENGRRTEKKLKMEDDQFFLKMEMTLKATNSN